MVDTKTLEKYKAALARFMSFLHGRSENNSYSPDHVHSVEALAAVSPNDVVRYMCLLAYGTTTPAPDANPVSRRGSTLHFDKKAISFFMPNREKWSVSRSEGNPTQSQEVNALIKRVKKRRRENKVQQRRQNVRCKMMNL